MPNIATFLKSEISRISRKEVRTATLALKKAASTHRSEIAALKRRAQALEQQVRLLTRVSAKAAPADGDVPSKAPRFSARRLVSQRRRLGLSAADCGLLLGASAQSIYNWEEGKVRPRTKHLVAIAKLAALGKKDAAARLASLKKTG